MSGWPTALLVGALAALAPRAAAASPPATEGFQRTAAPDQPYLPPGREGEVMALMRAALGEAGVTTPWSVAVERETLRLELGDGRQLHVAAPGRGGGAPAAQLAPGVWLGCATPCPPATVSASRALGAALAGERDRRAAQLWIFPPTPAAPPLARSALPARAAVGAGVVLGAWHALAGWRPRRPTAWELWLAAVVVASGALALVGAWGTLHEHGAFGPRLDCAHALDCAVDPKAPGWAAPMFQVYGPLLHVAPYTLALPRWLSLGFALLGLVLLRGLVRDLVGGLGVPAPQAEAAGLAAAGLLGLHPLALRVAVADSFWPAVVAALLAAALLARRAARTGAWTAALGAGGLLVPVLGGNLALAALWPTVLLAAACWGGRWTWRGLARTAAALAVPAAVTLAPLASALTVARAQGTTLLRALDWPELAALDPRLTPLAVPIGVAALALATVGQAGARARAFGPVVALLAPQPALTAAAGPVLGLAYPTGALNHHLSVVVAAALGGAGLGWVLSALGARRPPWVVPTWGALALTVLAPREGWRLHLEHHVPSAELAALHRLLPEVPEHDVLVVGSALQDHVPEPGDGDRLELHYPIGVHRAAAERRGGPAPRVMSIAEFLARGAEGRVLLYVGSALRSFKPSELRGGRVPPSLERDELTALRRGHVLEPVATFELPTAQSPYVTARLVADRAPAATLGFYWVQRRRGVAPAPDPAPDQPR